MTMLIAAIMMWLSANFELPLVHEQPTVKIVARDEMAAAANRGLPLSNAGELEALYDHRARVIMLSDRWTGATPADLSVLVHELVHHMQNVAGVTHACEAAREELAYAAQEKWLGLFGQSLSTTFGLDAATLKFKTVCL
jgi:hypothetical protein